jgi:hypothetical protein
MLSHTLKIQTSGDRICCSDLDSAYQLGVSLNVNAFGVGCLGLVKPLSDVAAVYGQLPFAGFDP